MATTSNNPRSLPSRGRRLSGLSCFRLPYPTPPTLTSVTSFWNLFKTFHLLLSPYLWDRPRVKNIENRYTEERLREIKMKKRHLHSEVGNQLSIFPSKGSDRLPSTVYILCPEYSKCQRTCGSKGQTRLSRWILQVRQRFLPPPAWTINIWSNPNGFVTFGMSVLQTFPVLRSSISIPPVAGA